MDDYLESSQTVEQATRKAQDLLKLLTLGGLTLRKFVTNEPSVSSQFQYGRKSPENYIKLLVTVADSSHVLGLRWNHRPDTLVVSRGTSPELNTVIAQPVVLSVVPSVYDPSGLVAPYTVKARFLLKHIWRIKGQQCDDDFSDAIVTQFLEWSREPPLLNEIAIPRSCF